MAKQLSRRAAVTAGAAGIGTLASAGPLTGAEAENMPLFSVPQVTIPVVGHSAVFPVRRIYCIGRNYAAHAREMGSDPNREPPFFFQKPADAARVVQPGATGSIAYPALTQNFHYEIELVAFLKSGGRNIAVETALEHVLGYTVGLDMTRRDLQNRMKDEQKPWEIGKSFDQSAPLGPVHLADKGGHFTNGRIALSVNGATKQESDLSRMIWSVAEQVSQLSRANELCAGDIIFSGTPENVGPVVAGDLMVGMISGLSDLAVRVVK